AKCTLEPPGLSRVAAQADALEVGLVVRATVLQAHDVVSSLRGHEAAEAADRVTPQDPPLQRLPLRPGGVAPRPLGGAARIRSSLLLLRVARATAAPAHERGAAGQGAGLQQTAWHRL